MIHTGTERYLCGWHFKGLESKWLEARKGNKIIARLYEKVKDEEGHILLKPGKKVITGIIIHVGTKNVTLKTGPDIWGKTITRLNCEKLRIEDIETFKVYPETSQKYKAIKLY